MMALIITDFPLNRMIRLLPVDHNTILELCFLSLFVGVLCKYAVPILSKFGVRKPKAQNCCTRHDQIYQIDELILLVT